MDMVARFMFVALAVLVVYVPPMVQAGQPNIDKANIVCSQRDAVERVGKAGRVIQSSFETVKSKLQAHVGGIIRAAKIPYPEPLGMCCCGAAGGDAWKFSEFAGTPLANQVQPNNTGWSNGCNNDPENAHLVWYGGPSHENRTGSYINGWTLEKDVAFASTAVESWPDILRDGVGPGGVHDIYRGPVEEGLGIVSWGFVSAGGVYSISTRVRKFGQLISLGVGRDIGPIDWGFLFGYENAAHVTDQERLKQGVLNGVSYLGENEPEGYPMFNILENKLWFNLAVPIVYTGEAMGVKFDNAPMGYAYIISFLQDLSLDALSNDGAINILLSTKQGALVTANAGEVPLVWGVNATIIDIAILDRPGYANAPMFRPLKSVRDAPTGEWGAIMDEIDKATPGQPIQGSRDFMISRDGVVEDQVPHFIAFYRFPIEGGETEFTAVTLIPRKQLERTASWLLPDLISETSKSSGAEPSLLTFVMNNTGVVDLVVRVASKPDWVTVDIEVLYLQASKFAIINITFNGADLGDVETTDVLVLSIADDEYPDCNVGELQTIKLYFDTTTDSSEVGIANMISVGVIVLVILVACGYMQYKVAMGEFSWDTVLAAMSNEYVGNLIRIVTNVSDTITYSFAFFTSIYGDDELTDVIPLAIVALVSSWIITLYATYTYLRNIYQVSMADNEEGAAAVKSFSEADQGNFKYAHTKANLRRTLDNKIVDLIGLLLESIPLNAVLLWSIFLSTTTSAVAVAALSLAMTMLGIKMTSVRTYAVVRNELQLLEDNEHLMEKLHGKRSSVTGGAGHELAMPLPSGSGSPTLGKVVKSPLQIA